MRERPAEYGSEASGTSQNAQSLHECLEHPTPAFFDRWRNFSREQLEESQQLRWKEDQRVESGEQYEDQCHRAEGKGRERAPSEGTAAGERGVEQRRRRQQQKHDRVEQAVYRQRCEGRRERYWRLARERVSPRDLARSRGYDVVDHHSDRRRPPEGTE